MKNILTIDVEDYFQVENFRSVVKFSDWGNYEDRVVNNTGRILDILAEVGVKATFFVLGWTAEKFPGLVKRIHEAGHETASHGYSHDTILTQTPETFREDIRKSKKILEDITGQPVLGYRAPTFSLTEKTRWALGILAEEGFKYDSSVLPICHKTRGLPEAVRYPHEINSGLWEFPVSVARIFGRNLQFSGGGYFRLLPYACVKHCIKKINTGNRPVVVYLHPWELDPDQPEIKAGPAERFKHYVNLDKTEMKLRKLLKDFEFTSIMSSPGLTGGSRSSMSGLPEQVGQ